MRIAPAPTVAVLGLGLMGGSLFQLLHGRGHPVVGYDPDAASRRLARNLLGKGPGKVAETLPAALDTADLTVIAVPLWAVGAVLDDIGHIGYSGLVTDVTSVKTSVTALARERLPQARWVGGHPMAGSEHSGFAASSAALLEGCAWVLCLDDDTQLDDWLGLAGWVTGLGCRVIPASSREHDQAVARISHVPHALAAALTATAADSPGGKAALSMAAGSFRDATRVANAAPETVAAWFQANAEAVAAGLTPLIDRLSRLRDALGADTPLPYETRRGLQQAHDIRAAWPPRPDTITRLPLTAATIGDLGRAGGWIVGVAADHLEAVFPRSG